MKKSKLIIFLIFSFGLITTCESQKNRSLEVDPQARELANQFFNWYINDVYRKSMISFQLPPYKKIGAKSYIFDIQEYETRLNKIDFFSSKFKKALIERLKTCNDDMKKVSWDDKPESQFNIRSCDYLWGDYWIGGQGEDIDGYSIIDEKTLGNSVEIIVEITINKKRFTKSKVLTVKEDGAYKIDNIELVWD